VSDGSVHLMLAFFAGAFIRTVALLAATISVACAPMAPAPNQTPPANNETLDALKAEVVLLTGQVSDLHTALAEVRSEQQAVTTELDVQTHAIGRVEGAISTLPDSLKKLCPPPRRAETQCKEPEVQRVVVSGSKMVVGDVEQIWVDPPGLPLNARIDTTAVNNSLVGDGIVEFERDGKSWVRFALHSPDSDEPVQIERRVSRHVRATQQGGEIKRPVVRMRIKLGDVQDTFSFVLTDRGDNPVVLGRTFLKDIALVEVGARYVQPRSKPAAAADDKSTP
jgi:hypothetical protein